MLQDLLLDLARVDIGAARNIHVGRPIGQVEEPFGIHMPEIAGQEPTVAERFGVGFGVVVITGKDSRTDYGNLSGLTGRDLFTLGVLNLNLHPRSGKTAGADPHHGIICRVLRRGQHGDIACDLAQAKILHQNRAQNLNRTHLIGAVHRRSGIDHVAQAGMVVFMNRRVFNEHFHDCWHGKGIRHAPFGNQAPNLSRVELCPAGQNGFHPMRHLR